MRRYIAAAVLSSVSLFSHAQNQIGPEACGIFAGSGLMDTSTKLSSDQRFAAHYQSTCSSKERNTGAKLDLAMVVKAVPINFGLSGSRAKLDQYCSDMEKMSESARYEAFSGSTLSNNLKGVLDKCLDSVIAANSSQNGVFVAVTPNNNALTEYMVTIIPKVTGSGVVKLMGYTANTDVVCRQGAAEIPRGTSFLTSAIPLSVNARNVFICSNPSPDGTMISFQTDRFGSSEAVRLPGSNDMRLLEFQVKVERLQNQVDAQTKILEDQAGRKPVLRDCDYPISINKGGWWNSYDKALDASCPTDQVMSGVHSVHHDGHEDRRFRFKCCKIVLE